LDELLRSLNIKGDDIGSVFIPKVEVESPSDETKCMAVMRLLTPKSFTAASLKKTLCFSWATARGVL
jgi:hypothetical protein